MTTDFTDSMAINTLLSKVVWGDKDNDEYYDHSSGYGPGKNPRNPLEESVVGFLDGLIWY